MVKELKIVPGDKVSEGTLLLVMLLSPNLLLLQRKIASSPGRTSESSCTICSITRHNTSPECRQLWRELQRCLRSGLRRAGAGCWPWRLFGSVSRGRPGSEGGAGRALRPTRRRLPERRLHPQQSPAARGCRHGLGGGIIGLEMGTVYSTLGARLDVVEMTCGPVCTCCLPTHIRSQTQTQRPAPPRAHAAVQNHCPTFRDLARTRQRRLV